MSTTAQLLMLGHEPTLLSSRCWILEKAGFSIRGAERTKDAARIILTDPIRLFILCHTLTSEECRTTLEEAHELRPEMKALVLTATTPTCSLRKQDAVFSIFEGPKALIETVKQMLAS